MARGNEGKHPCARGYQGALGGWSCKPPAGSEGKIGEMRVGKGMRMVPLTHYESLLSFAIGCHRYLEIHSVSPTLWP